MKISQAPTIDGDRRRYERLPFHRPCKLCDDRDNRYLGGVTQDVSAGGALIMMPRLVALNPGDTIHLGVATKRRQNFLHRAEMIKATVKRTFHTVDDRTVLGVEFEQPLVELAGVAVAEPLRMAA